MRFNVPIVKKVQINSICRRKLKRLKRKGLVYEIPNYVFTFYDQWYEEFNFCIDGAVDDDLFFNEKLKVSFCHSVSGRRRLFYNSVKIVDYISTYERKYYSWGKYSSLILIFNNKKEAVKFKLLL